MSKPWGGTTIGSWAAEAERADAEDSEFELTFPTPTQTQTQTQTPTPTPTPTHPPTNPQSYPSLKDSISTKPKKKKMTLSEFYGSSSGPHSHDDLIHLPTAPKSRPDTDLYASGGPRLGGGFSNYGDDRRGGGGPPRRPGGGGFNYDDDRRGGGPPPPRESHVPSRADEVDNWATAKRSFVPTLDSGRGTSGAGRYGGLGGGSRADEVDNWNLGKKVGTPGPGVGPARGGGGLGFRDTGSDWRSGGGRVSYEPPGVEPKPKPNPFGAARPREKVLEEKGLDWKKLDMELEVKKVGSSSGGSRPTSSHGSRPTSSHSNRSENFGLGVGVDGGVEVKTTRPKVNPFGDAKPREVLLEEKGLDWKKMDLELEHRKIDRPETEEEKALKEEIDNLKKKLEKESGDGVAQEDGGEQTSLRDLIEVKVKDLDTLIRELDDKARFGQKAVERPGSGAGRRATYPDRTPQSGSIDGGRGAEFMDRSRSRGPGDVWSRPGEDRRGGFQGSRDRGFMNNRDFDRSRPRDRW